MEVEVPRIGNTDISTFNGAGEIKMDKKKRKKAKINRDYAPVKEMTPNWSVSEGVDASGEKPKDTKPNLGHSNEVS